LTDILKRVQRLERNREELAWEGSFQEYLDLVMQNPRIARSSHRRIYDMIAAQGKEDSEGLTSYRFFSQDLFGIEETLEILVEEYLKPAALDMDVKNRVLVLVGPVGSGKSTIVSLMKRGLERYSLTDEGALYGIKGCPMQEEPLHLIPEELRDSLRERGIMVEGTLCPSCRLKVKEEYGGDISRVPVERIFISEADRVGIGTFVPSDPKSQDIAELTGSIDFSAITEYGSESDPRAYRFDGELNIANRGLMEFQEILKCDAKFLYNLLSLAQEGNFKAGRFALISADEVVVGHTNPAEYERFVKESTNEAMVSRMYLISVPYNLRLSQEERIYRKLLGTMTGKIIHFAPYALRTAAMFSILTRLKDPCRQDISLVKKLFLYDGQGEDRYTKRDVEELRLESPREGMFGIDPRFVINRICSAVAANSKGCITAGEILTFLKNGLAKDPLAGGGDMGRWERLLFMAENEYRTSVKKDLAYACISCYPDTAQQVFNDYMKSVSTDRRGGGASKASSTEKCQGFSMAVDSASPDVRLMEFIENYMELSVSGKKVFREELVSRRTKYASAGKSFDYAAHSGLKDAVEAEVLRRVLAGVFPGAKEGEARTRLLREALIERFGYCPLCAEAVIREGAGFTDH
jgi:serine protein kinase